MNHAPPPRRPPALPAPITLNSVPFLLQADGTYLCPLPADTETVNGASYRLELRLLPVNPPPPPPTPGPAPAPLPNPTPAPVPSASIYGVLGPFGGSVRSGTAGQTVVIQGSHLGTGGQIRFGPVPAVVLNWTDTAITVTLPAPAAPATFLVGKIQAVLQSGNVVTGAFDFSVGR